MRHLSATAAAAALVALAAGPASAVAANPATWRISQVTRLPFSSFYDAVALSPTNVWALGKHATRQGPLVSMVWHWNGRTWRRAPFPVSADGLSVYPAIAGTGRGWHEVRLPGVRGKQTDVGLLVRAPRSRALFALGELDWSNTPTLSYGAILRYAR